MTLVCCRHRLAAQRAAPPVPIRPLGAAIGTSAIRSRQIQHFRALSDGRVLINDPGKRQVILLDARSRTRRSSSTRPAARRCTAGCGRAHSVCRRLDAVRRPNASAFLVIDPKGDVARVMSAPAGNAATYLTNPSTYGFPGYSPTFGIVYRLPMPRPQIERPPRASRRSRRKFDDSALVMTMNIKRRTVDTLARVYGGAR